MRRRLLVSLAIALTAVAGCSQYAAYPSWVAPVHPLVNPPTRVAPYLRSSQTPSQSAHPGSSHVSATYGYRLENEFADLTLFAEHEYRWDHDPELREDVGGAERRTWTDEVRVLAKQDDLYIAAVLVVDGEERLWRGLPSPPERMVRGEASAFSVTLPYEPGKRYDWRFYLYSDLAGVEQGVAAAVISAPRHMP